MGYMTDKFNDLCERYDLKPNIRMEHIDVKIYGVKGYNSHCSIQGKAMLRMAVDKREHINVTRCIGEFARFSMACLELDKMDKERSND